MRTRANNDDCGRDTGAAQADRTRDRQGAAESGIIRPADRRPAPSVISITQHRPPPSMPPASHGDYFPFATGLFGTAGSSQIGIQGAVFALFNLDAPSHDLINADYWIGLPVSYRKGLWSFFGRVYHQSSHLGDEFLLDTPGVNRINLSYEESEALASYDWRKWRFYASGGYIFHSEPTRRPWTSQYRYRIPVATFYSRTRPDRCRRLAGQTSTRLAAESLIPARAGIPPRRPAGSTHAGKLPRLLAERAVLSRPPALYRPGDLFRPVDRRQLRAVACYGISTRTCAWPRVPARPLAVSRPCRTRASSRQSLHYRSRTTPAPL